MPLSEFMFGKKGGFEQIPTMNPQQQQLLQQLLSGLGGATGQGFDFLSNILGRDTSQFEAPLMRQFQEQTIPQLAERFAGFGGLSSGSFNQALGQAGAGLAEQLGALRGQLGLQGLGHLTNMMGQGLGARPFESVYRPETSGFVGALAPALGAGLGMGLTGGAGVGIGRLLKLLQGIIGNKPKLRSGEMYSPGFGYQSAG